MNSNKNIAIIGAGYVGLCTGAILNEIGMNIIFVDVDKEKVKSINSGKSPVYEPGLDEIISKGVLNGSIKATDNYSDIKSIKTIIISTNTPINKNFEVNLKFFISALKSLSKIISKESLIIIRSTVPPLTTRNIVVPILENQGFKVGKDIYLAVMPERLAEGHALKDMKENPMILGAIDEETTNRIKEIFSPLNLKIMEVNWEEAELTKLADNMWIDLNIALANEIALVSEKIGADARKVIDAANTLKKGSSYVNILTPGIGVGGSCLPKDPYILERFAKKMNIKLRLPKISRKINDYMPIHTFEIISSLTKEKDFLIIGVSFNSNSGDMRYSPSIFLNNKLQENGYRVYVYDPLVSDKDMKLLKNVFVISDEKELFSKLKNINVIVVGAKHDIFKPLVPKILENIKGKIIIDGRYLFNRDDVINKDGKYFAIGVGYK